MTGRDGLTALDNAVANRLDVSPRWAATVGALIGAAWLTAFDVWAVTQGGEIVAAVFMTLVLLLPLAGRWPLSRWRVVTAGVMWLVIGVLLAIFGGGFIAFAALPAFVGVLVGWGTRPAMPPPAVEHRNEAAQDA